MSDDHWGYILVAYGVTAATVLVVALRIWLEHRRLAAALARLERDGAGEESETR
jgi:heme exporter protein CcmD